MARSSVGVWCCSSAPPPHKRHTLCPPHLLELHHAVLDLPQVEQRQVVLFAPHRLGLRREDPSHGTAPPEAVRVESREEVRLRLHRVVDEGPRWGGALVLAIRGGGRCARQGDNRLPQRENNSLCSNPLMLSLLNGDRGRNHFRNPGLASTHQHIHPATCTPAPCSPATRGGGGAGPILRIIMAKNWHLGNRGMRGGSLLLGELTGDIEPPTQN